MIEAMVELVEAARARLAPERSVLAALSGIDGSGKGFVAARIADALAARGLRVASINIDAWLNLPQVRSTPTSRPRPRPPSSSTATRSTTSTSCWSRASIC